ncbi:MAG: FAD:protein FMN transferase [Granulosicoccus sp.]|nr:FAD:protein FMN transferase [Granulosicoccus sp.]
MQLLNKSMFSVGPGLPVSLLMGQLMGLLLSLLMAASAWADSEPITAAGETMGTHWHAQWSGSVSRRSDIEGALINELQRINRLMSTWDPQSDLSLFNKSGSLEQVSLHPDILTVVDTAVAVSKQTEGRYDITLDPVIRLWGFGHSESVARPSDQMITQALAATGYQKLLRDSDKIRKLRSDVSVDLSSLAKGFAVDQLGQILESYDVNHYLVEIGGEVRARGVKHTGDAWRVGIENPEGYADQGIYLRDTQVASSGTYRNYRLENGQRLSHIIDGRTGRPVEHYLVAVTVLHESTMLADAWATALLVVGESEARRLIEEQNLVAQLTVVENNAFRVERTPSFEKLLVH